jgi:L-iditol 2-dehydrogenase
MPPGFDARRLHRDEIRLVGARGQTLEDWQRAARLLATGAVNVKPLISGCFPLNEIAAALDAALLPATFRIVVNP